MEKIYATLIRKGLKSIDDVPDGLKEKVIKILNAQVNDRNTLDQSGGTVEESPVAELPEIKESEVQKMKIYKTYKAKPISYDSTKKEVEKM